MRIVITTNLAETIQILNMPNACEHFKLEEMTAVWNIAPRSLAETSVYFNETTRRYISELLSSCSPQ
jgi:hypothetical protein